MVYYIDEDFLKNTSYIINKFCTQKFDDNHILITTDHGGWVVLSGDEYDLLLRNRVEEKSDLYLILEDKGVILTENNQDKIIQVYRQKFGYLSNGISLHIIAPTSRCNHNCLYCHANSKDMSASGYDMDENTAKAVVDFIFQTPSNFINIEFQGGEPLALFHIVQYIIEYVKEKNNSPNCSNQGWFFGNKNVSFEIVSNLTLMDNDILDYLMKNGVRISTSLDGPKELHDKNRLYKGDRGSYDNVVQWVEEIKNMGGRLNAIPTITKYSLPYAKEIVDEYLRHGLFHARMRELNIAGMAVKEWDKIGYTPKEFLIFWKKYLEYVININKKGVRFRDDTTFFILSRILFKKAQLNSCFNSPCGVGTIQCAYDYNGDIYTCDEARSVETFWIGNANIERYKDVFTFNRTSNYISNYVADFIRLSSCTQFLCDTCVWHPFCSPCLVCAYGQEKSLVPKFPNFICSIRGGQTEHIFQKLIFSEDKNILMNWMKKF